MAEKVSTISSFYRDRSILITGATGFMGKVLVEKLLRSCGGIKTIYLLLRPKKGQAAKERLENLLKVKVFERVKSEQPDAISKLVVIHGDLTSDGIGIASSDLNLLTENVSIVFHFAATVRFEEPLKRSVDMNVLGTRRLVELSRKMEKLEAFVHASTAYCNCDRKEVDEVVYQAPDHPQNIIDAIKWMDDDLLEALTPQLIRKRPNIYTYTKALAETLLVEEACDLPVAIVRPSIVTASRKEPFPGWIDSYNGVTGMLAGIYKGVLRTGYCKPSCAIDIIPVDVAINLAITVAWYTASQRPNNILVYNCTSGSINKITWSDVSKYGKPVTLRYPSNEMFRYPSFDVSHGKIRNYVSVILFHHVPAYFIDLMLVLAWRKPMVVSLYKKVHRAIETFQLFTINEWTFSSKNVLMLHETLPAEDREEFDFNIRSLQWSTYFEDYALGVRQYLLKEDPSTLPEARKKLKRLYVYTKLGQLLFLLLLWQFVSFTVPVIQSYGSCFYQSLQNFTACCMEPSQVATTVDSTTLQF